MKTIYIIIALVIIALGASLLLNNEEKNQEIVVKEDSQEIKITDETAVETEQEKIENQEITTSKGSLKDYTGPTDFENLTGTNILFFKATWCPTCVQLNKSLIEDKDNIPANVTIWLVDYDDNKEMRIKYGVTMQDTLVQVDTELNKINLWRGGFTLNDVLRNII